MVGRVFPRHGHRGRPLNEAVRQHSGSAMNLPKSTITLIATPRAAGAIRAWARLTGTSGLRLNAAVSATLRVRPACSLLAGAPSSVVESGRDLKQRGLRNMLPNNSLERTVSYGGPHPGCQLLLAGSMRQAATWPAAQLSR